MKVILVVLITILTFTETHSAFGRTVVRGTSSWERGRVLRALQKKDSIGYSKSGSSEYLNPQFPSFINFFFFGGIMMGYFMLNKTFPPKNKK